MRLKNKTTLITGGTSGIGLGVAKAFKEEGAIGAVIGRSQEKIDVAINDLSSDFTGYSTDVTDLKALDEMYVQFEKDYGKLDALVVNAGGAIGEGSLGSVHETSEAYFDSMMALNLKSVFFTVQKAIPLMNPGASIILVASIAVHKGFAGLTVYSAAKAGVRSFARTFSQDLLEQQIRVNVLSPGTVDTPLFGNLGLPEDVAMGAKQQFTELIPIKRIGVPKDMAGAAVFLASDESSFMLGSEIIVDGGVANL